ncbi:inositol monophosphatase family protein [Hydrogenimonas cancrithermarum]|uniref:Inositol monophosphatase n=1 Tax=Hydrogenimonas cancrithermarum TaxID=2993563 RepID=A0ABN6WTX5_9BACT|nr:inositol monophosphatase family protein [Hydrogenimonas cancrithermarum]BDY12323.1 inositol monophosphatase [Hydrogenimonas cancrithermarum]
MTDFVRAAIDAAKELSDLLQGGWRTEYAEYGTIGAGGDKTAGIDTLAENLYIERLSKFGKIDSEECGVVGSGEATVILDPIDGSENAISGLPYFGSSIALEREGKVEEAVVVNLANGDLFFKTENVLMHGKVGRPGYLPVETRRDATIGIFERAYANPELALALLWQKRKFRSPGAVALSLAYAHYVDFVIFAGSRRRYDFAAALWMCEGLDIIEEDELLIIAKNPETASSLQRLAYGNKESQ